MWSINLRISKSFAFRSRKEVPALHFNVDVDNLFNHLNPGGFIGNLARRCSANRLRLICIGIRRIIAEFSLGRSLRSEGSQCGGLTGTR
jgi:hypothetical protein